MDKELLWIINQEWTHPMIDYIMAVASSIDLWLPVLILLGIVVAIFGGFRGRALLVCLAVVILICDGVVVQAVKKTVGRPRPNEVVDGLRLVDLERATPRVRALFMPLYTRETRVTPGAIDGRSFPSGHTMNNFCVAGVLLIFFRRWGWLYLFPAILVSYSRIYTAAHWPSDVIISALLGLGLAFLILAFLEMLWRRWGEWILPATRRAHPSLIRPTGEAGA